MDEIMRGIRKMRVSHNRKYLTVPNNNKKLDIDDIMLRLNKVSIADTNKIKKCTKYIAVIDKLNSKQHCYDTVIIVPQWVC